MGGLCGQSNLNETFCRLERFSRRDGRSRGLKEEATVMVQFFGIWFGLIFCGHLYGGCSVSVQATASSVNCNRASSLPGRQSGSGSRFGLHSEINRFAIAARQILGQVMIDL